MNECLVGRNKHLGVCPSPSSGPYSHQDASLGAEKRILGWDWGREGKGRSCQGYFLARKEDAWKLEDRAVPSRSGGQGSSPTV